MLCFDRLAKNKIREIDKDIFKEKKQNHQIKVSTHLLIHHYPHINVYPSSKTSCKVSCQILRPCMEQLRSCDGWLAKQLWKAIQSFKTTHSFNL